MSFISTKVLVDIPLKDMFSEPPRDAKIIFQRKKDFSLESISLIIKKLFFGKQMKQAAVDRMKNICQTLNVNTPEAQQFVDGLTNKMSVATTEVTNVFAKIKMDNSLENLVNKESINLNLPDELNFIVTENIQTKLSDELAAINRSEKLPRENLREIQLLLKKTQSDFNYTKEILLADINNYDLQKIDENYSDITLSVMKKHLDNLNNTISKNNDNDYSSKIKACIKKLTDKVILVLANKNNQIEIKEKEKNERIALKKERVGLAEQKSLNLLNKISNLLSEHQLIPELKLKPVSNLPADIAFNQALFKNVKDVTIIEYLAPLSHYLKFGEIALNKTSAPILEHLLKDEDNLIENMKTNLNKEYKVPKYQTNSRDIVTRVKKVDYPSKLENALIKLRQDLDKFNAMPDSEKREQVDTLDQMKNSQDL